MKITDFHVTLIKIVPMSFLLTLNSYLTTGMDQPSKTFNSSKSTIEKLRNV